MKRIKSILFFVVAFSGVVLIPLDASPDVDVKLPKPVLTSKMSVETSMLRKKSVRHFSTTPLTLEQVSQLLWAANGALPVEAISGATVKTLPSAGGIYPLEIFLLTGNGTVKGLPAGVYNYNSTGNSLAPISTDDVRMAVAQAALSQLWLANAPAMVVIAGAFAKTTAKYGNRGIPYVYMESGASNQNLYLQAEALGLRMGTVGAFNEAQVSSAMKIPSGITPLLIVAIGK